MVLTYRDEYANFEGGATLNIQLLQEFLVDQGDLLKGAGFANRFPQLQHQTSYTLLGHCSEKTLAPASQQQWQRIFHSAGLQLNILETGCCGMAGIYGYEAEHLATSKDIYQLSWGQHLSSDVNTRVNYLATGFSCRAQVKRFAGWLPLHPIQALQQEIKKI